MTEARLWICLAHWVTGRGRTATAHPYGQNSRILLAVMCGLTLVEGAVVEAVLAVLLPGTPWPWILLALHLYALLWIAGVGASLRTRPHLLEPDQLRLRDSVFAEIIIPLTTITGARAIRRAGPCRSGFTVDPSGETAVLGYGDTTIMLLLDPDESVYVEGTPPVTGLHRLRVTVDDPRRLLEALSVADGVG